MHRFSRALILLSIAPLGNAFFPRGPRRTVWVSQNVVQRSPAAEDDIPLDATPPIRVGMLIEPTPFTHVSGYSNRFKELLMYLQKADDNVEIVTVDDVPECPKHFGPYPINTIKGFRFPLYNEICLTFDIKQRKVWKSMKRFQPDIIHCTSPGFIVYIALFTAKFLNIPLVLRSERYSFFMCPPYFSWR